MIKKVSLFIAVSFFVAGIAFANSKTGSLQVSVTVGETVTVTTSTHVDFGTVVAGDTNIDAEGEITVTASNSLTYKIGLGGGKNQASGARHVSNKNATCRYNLYHDTARTLEWGDSGMDGSDFPSADPTVDIIGTGKPQIMPVYARLPVAPVQDGTYTDVIFVRVEW